MGFGRFDLRGKGAGVDELAGGAIYLVSDPAFLVTGEILVIDGRFLARGVNR